MGFQIPSILVRFSEKLLDDNRKSSLHSEYPRKNPFSPASFGGLSSSGALAGQPFADSPLCPCPLGAHHPDYTPEGFERAFAGYFTLHEKRPLEGSARALYLMEKK